MMGEGRGLGWEEGIYSAKDVSFFIFDGVLANMLAKTALIRRWQRTVDDAF